MKPLIVDTVKSIIQNMVDGNYAYIESLTLGVRVSAEAIERAISEYGRTLIMPPDSAFESIDVIQIQDASMEGYSVRCHLWTEQEGESDLSIELTVFISEDRVLKLEFDDILVF